MDLIRQLGPLAFGSRLKRLSDRLMQDGIKIYRACDIDFEPKWFPVFYFLADRGPSAVTDIARGIGITHPSVNQIAKEMVAQGYIAAYKDPKDKRRRVLALSTKGKAQRQTLTQVWSLVEASLQELIDEAGPDFLGQIELMENALQKHSFFDRFSQKYDADAPYRIVGFQPEYADAFRQINLDWINEYFKVEAADLKVLDDPIGKIIEPGGEILFAVDRFDQVIGTCALIRHNDTVAELAKMGVKKTRKTTGAGKMLGIATLERARARGFNKVFLETNSSLAPAIGLYKKLGFKQLPFPTQSDYVRADVYMEWRGSNSSDPVE